MVVFLFFVVLFQMFLPGSMVEKSGEDEMVVRYGDLNILKEMGVFEFGENVRFEPTKLLEKFQKEARAANLHSSAFNRTLHRFGYRKPRLALVSIRLLQPMLVGYQFLLYGILFGLSYFVVDVYLADSHFSFDCLFDFIFYLKAFADLLVDSQQLLMVTVAVALQEIGYEIQVVYCAIFCLV